MATKKIVYSEPDDYFPKEIRDKYFGDSSGSKKKTAAKKKPAAKKTVKRSK